MAAPVLLNHRRTVSGVLPADGPDPDFIQPTTDYGDTHIAGGAEHDRQALLSKASEADKANWDDLLYSDSTVQLENATGGGLVQGDVVAFANPASVDLDDTLSSQNHFAVCAEATLADTVTGRFWASAVIPVVKNQGSVTALHYLRKSATSKAVEDTGVAAGPTVQVPSGALGLALATAAGSGTISALWFTRPAPLMPALTAGYLKGSGTAYATQAVPIPIADISTGTPTGAKFLRDDGVLAEPPGAGADPILDRVTSPVTVAGTATETTIYSKQIDANTLSTNKRLRLVLLLAWGRTPTSTGLRQFTLRFKYGATTVVTAAPVIVDNGGVTVGASSAGYIEFLLSAAGATNAQIGHAMVRGGAVVGAAVGTYESVAGQNVHRGTAAVDSTANQNLVVTVQWNTGADGSAIVATDHAILERL